MVILETYNTNTDIKYKFHYDETKGDVAEEPTIINILLYNYNTF